MKPLVRYFVERPTITNLIFAAVLVGAFVAWDRIGKEEMPDFEMPWLRANIAYPGASAEDVEVLVTRLVEEQLKGISGIEEVFSTSSYGASGFRIALDPKRDDIRDTIQQIKDAFDRAQLPIQAEDPVFSRFTSAEKAIIDVALFHKDQELLDVEGRQRLQQYVLAFESQLMNLEAISGVERNGYVRPELQIVIEPEKLKRFEISLDEVRRQISDHNIRVPSGTMEDRDETEITVVSELNSVEPLEKLIIRGGFEGQKLTLGQVAKIQRGFADYKTITKVQGHEAILLNVKKSTRSDILSSTEAVGAFVKRFLADHKGSPLGIVLIDDESYDVRNRIQLISINGLTGFLLIVLVLFVFLDFRSGVWVAMGIPFALAFTLICALFMGYTVNNMTLASIVIVLGIVVDDAIIVAENVSRRRFEGVASVKAAVEGTATVLGPIVASILTTCVAFLPLFFFEGHLGVFVKYIPVIVFMMLAASLIESICVLPGHLSHPVPLLERKQAEASRGHWMLKVEQSYAGVLERLLRFRFPVLLGFVVLLGLSAYLFRSEMRFVLFPREEATRISVRVKAPEETNRLDMARKIRSLENMFLAEEGIVTSVLSRVAQSRRGGMIHDNEASIRVELTPPSDRNVSLSTLLKRWEERVKEFDGFTEVKFIRSRFGSGSGSPIHLEVRENDDATRAKVSERVAELMRGVQGVKNVEVEKPILRPEYRAHLDQQAIMRLNVNARSLAEAFRAYVEGEVLYRFIEGDEEVDVRLTSAAENKKDLKGIMDLRAANSQNYLVPFGNLVTLEEGRKPANIVRKDFKRVTEIYADLEEPAPLTPLEVARELEKGFPPVAAEYPSSVIKFAGEIQDSRESRGDFGFSLALVLVLIYVLLVALYGSLVVPLVIGSAIPFGVVGVILAFYLHGMEQYGFFSVIGTLGMIGVVVNDAIVLVAKLEGEQDWGACEALDLRVAQVAASRLRAVVVTTLTTVAGLLPTAYGLAGYDSMLAEMMLAMAWGLVFGTVITLVLIPCVYRVYVGAKVRLS